MTVCNNTVAEGNLLQGALGLSGGAWSANWQITKSTKCVHLLRRLIDIGAAPAEASPQVCCSLTFVAYSNTCIHARYTCGHAHTCKAVHGAVAAPDGHWCFSCRGLALGLQLLHITAVLQYLQILVWHWKHIQVFNTLQVLGI